MIVKMTSAEAKAVDFAKIFNRTATYQEWICSKDGFLSGYEAARKDASLPDLGRDMVEKEVGGQIGKGRDPLYRVMTLARLKEIKQQILTEGPQYASYFHVNELIDALERVL